jgi:hypothetical protein
MQNDIDIRNAKLENREDLETIQALRKPASFWVERFLANRTSSKDHLKG